MWTLSNLQMGRLQWPGSYVSHVRHMSNTWPQWRTLLLLKHCHCPAECFFSPHGLCPNECPLCFVTGSYQTLHILSLHLSSTSSHWVVMEWTSGSQVQLTDCCYVVPASRSIGPQMRCQHSLLGNQQCRLIRKNTEQFLHSVSGGVQKLNTITDGCIRLKVQSCYWEWIYQYLDHNKSRGVHKLNFIVQCAAFNVL